VVWFGPQPWQWQSSSTIFCLVHRILVECTQKAKKMHMQLGYYTARLLGSRIYPNPTFHAVCASFYHFRPSPGRSVGRSIETYYVLVVVYSFAPTTAGRNLALQGHTYIYPWHVILSWLNKHTCPTRIVCKCLFCCTRTKYLYRISIVTYMCWLIIFLVTIIYSYYYIICHLKLYKIHLPNHPTLITFTESTKQIALKHNTPSKSMTQIAG
jgi:hypothetical protein